MALNAEQILVPAIIRIGAQRARAFSIRLCQNRPLSNLNMYFRELFTSNLARQNSFNATMKIWILAHHIRCAGGQSPILSVVIPTNPGW